MPPALRPVSIQQCGIGGARALPTRSSSRDKTKRNVPANYGLQRKEHPAAGPPAAANATAAATAASAAATFAPDLGLFAAVTIGAAVAPWLMEFVKPWLRPIRCRECMGATTTLCTRCGARGKVRFVLGSASVSLPRMSPRWLDMLYISCSQVFGLVTIETSHSQRIYLDPAIAAPSICKPRSHLGMQLQRLLILCTAHARNPAQKRLPGPLSTHGFAGGRLDHELATSAVCTVHRPRSSCLQLLQGQR